MVTDIKSKSSFTYPFHSVLYSYSTLSHEHCIMVGYQPFILISVFCAVHCIAGRWELCLCCISPGHSTEPYIWQTVNIWNFTVLLLSNEQRFSLS